MIDHDEHLRVPPHSIEAEQEVLGGLMLSNAAWWSVADVVTAGDFYRRDHRLIFAAIAEAAGKQQVFDWLTIGAALADRGHAEDVGGENYLFTLNSQTASAANIRAYAEIVADRARMRRLIEVGIAVVNAGFNPEGRTGMELVGEAQTRLGSLLATEPCELESVGPIMRRVYDRLAERATAGERIHGLTIGLSELDELLGGLCPGLYVLAARPKNGKTTLAVNIAEHVALIHKRPVAVFSFEMQPEELGNRMLASVGNIDASNIRSGDMDEADWANATAAMRKLKDAEIFVTRPRNARVEHVVAQVRRQHAIKPLGLVVIDYLQLMQTSGDNRAQGLGDITRALKLMSGELGLPVLLLSQLSRDLEKRPDKRPILADLRDSGAIEQDADAVLFIYRDEIYHKDSRYKGTAEIIVGAQRNGPPGDVRVLYMPERFKFQNLPEGWIPEPVEEKAQAQPRRGFRRGGRDAAAGAQ